MTLIIVHFPPTPALNHNGEGSDGRAAILTLPPAAPPCCNPPPRRNLDDCWPTATTDPLPVPTAPFVLPPVTPPGDGPLLPPTLAGEGAFLSLSFPAVALEPVALEPSLPGDASYGDRVAARQPPVPFRDSVLSPGRDGERPGASRDNTLPGVAPPPLYGAGDRRAGLGLLRFLLGLLRTGEEVASCPVSS
jgi:hypothetical protein